MDFSLLNKRKFRMLIHTIFIILWMINFADVDKLYPVYLLFGFFCVLCLWYVPETEKKKSLGFCFISVLFGIASVGLNLSVFQPVASLLSHSDMAMSILGAAFACFHILSGAASSDRKKNLWHPAVLLRVVFVFIWLLILRPTDSRYGVYLFCGLMSLLCICRNMGREATSPKHINWVLAFFSCLFSLAVISANYLLYLPLLTLRSLSLLACSLLGGFFTAYHLLLTLIDAIPLKQISRRQSHSCRVFWLTVGIVFTINILFLFSSCYPGLLTQDSGSTIAQIMGEQPYNNTMPFWHTVTVQPFFQLGLFLTGTVEGGIALFHCIQALFMAACFGYVLVTLYQIGVPNLVLLLVGCLYACLPYNIVYSVTLWKDVPFSGAALLFVTALYRLLRQVGKSCKLNYAMLIIGALGFSLWRTNGWYAFLVTAVVLALLLGKKQGKLVAVMSIVLIVCWVLINPVLDGLEVSETNLVEAFAVPMQQVARVVANERYMTEESRNLLSEIFWLNSMAELYNPNSVDPVKFYAFRNENIHYITENPLAYLGLYFRLGLQYPADYFLAWVEETKGYWNAGYDYWIYDLNPQYALANPVAAIFTSAFRFLNETEGMKLFSSIGLYVWGMIACLIVNVLKRRKEFLLTIPPLVLVVGLWIGTPVFCEFRYAYPVMLTLPMIVCVTLYQKPDF